MIYETLVNVVKAWVVPGTNPDYHYKMQEDVRAKMPVLAKELDRLTESILEVTEPNLREDNE